VRTVADLIELDELEIRAEALIAELGETFARIRELKSKCQLDTLVDEAGSNLRRRSR